MRTVLFTCTHHADRSRMAEAFFTPLAPDDVRAESAGSDPARAVRPEVVEAMREVGVDLAGHRPQKQRLDAIRADGTAHQHRLAHLLPRLIERFPHTPDEEIRSCADAVLAEYADASVRSYTLLLAEREARECLAAGDCALV